MPKRNFTSPQFAIRPSTNLSSLSATPAFKEVLLMIEILHDFLYQNIPKKGIVIVKYALRDTGFTYTYIYIYIYMTYSFFHLSVYSYMCLSHQQYCITRCRDARHSRPPRALFGISPGVARPFRGPLGAQSGGQHGCLGSSETSIQNESYLGAP